MYMTNICQFLFLYIKKMATIQRIGKSKEEIIHHQMGPYIRFNCIITNLLKTSYCRKSQGQSENAYQALKQEQQKQMNKYKHKRRASEGTQFYKSYKSIDHRTEREFNKEDIKNAEKIRQIEEKIIETANHLVRPDLHPEEYLKSKMVNYQQFKNVKPINSKNCLKKIAAAKSKMCQAMKKQKTVKNVQKKQKSFIDSNTCLSSISMSKQQSRYSQYEKDDQQQIAKILKKLEKKDFNTVYNSQRRKITNRVFSSLQRQQTIQKIKKSGANSHSTSIKQKQ